MRRAVKVLYVEDEPFLGKIVKESLESRGYVVEMATDGVAAIELFRKCSPDVCLLDVMLPKKDGFTLGREIRLLNPGIPILFLTAKDQTEDVLEGFKSGGNDYIKKPFSMEELIARIENMWKMYAAGDSNSDTLQIGSIGRFAFHYKEMKLVNEDETVKLSHRENELLKLLASHPNQVIERKQILNALWGDDHFFNSRNLDVYIRKLRSHLAKDPHVQIVTLKGVGYRFVC
ncbi:MAG: response regulator transcription factor [Saprospiraceae bacterium]|nr:response regulator transcription factor [Saprospiraceae bacterium]